MLPGVRAFFQVCVCVRFLLEKRVLIGVNISAAALHACV